MKKIFLLAIVMLTIFSCQNKTENKNEPIINKEKEVKKKNIKAVLDKGCFEYNNNGNTITMEITEVSEKVKGNLDIVYAEKDSNRGSFVGQLKNNKLIGVYTFLSEGIESSREMAFLVKGDQLIEGYGELNNNGTKFKDTTTIKYTSAMPLTKVECKK